MDRASKRRQVKPLAASLLDVLDYDSSDDSDFEVGDADASGNRCLLACDCCTDWWVDVCHDVLYKSLKQADKHNIKGREIISDAAPTYVPA